MKRFWLSGGLPSLTVLLVLLAGCGEDPPKTASPPQAQDRLPKLGEYLMPLDDGRVEIAPPAGWVTPPRKSEFLVWFKKSNQETYPCILVTVEDHDGIANVTPKNVEAFVKELAEGFKADGATAKLARSITPVKIGSFAGAAYRRRGKVKQDFKTIVLDRLIVETAADGRKYRFELRVRDGAVDKYQPYVLAVASGTKYLKADRGQPAPPPKVEVEPQAKETPLAEEKPQVKKSAPKKEPPAEPKTKKKEKPAEASDLDLIEEEEL